MERLKTYISRLLLVCFLAGGFSLSAQEIQFAQFFNDPFQLNPALAGASRYHRMGLHYRDQWPGVKNNFKSYAGFIDTKLNSINSGIGAVLLHDVAGDGALSYTSLSTNYAHGVRLNYNQMLRLGIRVAFANRRIDFNKLLFTDQLIRETNGVSVEGFNTNQVSYFDVGFGMEWKHRKRNLRLGAAVEHLNQPNQSFTSQKNPLPIRYSGYVLFDLDQPGLSTRENPVYTQFVFLYKNQLRWDQVDVGAIMHLGPFEWGLNYRGIPGLKSYKEGYLNNEALIVYLGYQYLNMHVGYNYDLTISQYGNSNSFGAHEMTVIFAVGNGVKKKKRRSIPCSDIVGSSFVKKMRF